MKQKNSLKILLLFLFTLISYVLESQTLNTGDIAFIGYHESANDQFTWIALKTIPAGEKIYFSDQGWSATGNAWFNNTERHILYTAPVGKLTSGTIVHIEESAPDIFTVTGGGTAALTSGSSWSLISGDQVLAYKGGSGVKPPAPIFLAAIHNDYTPDDYNTTTKWNNGANLTGNAYSMLPKGLTNGENCISLNPGVTEINNHRYTGTLSGTKALLLAAINNTDNWQVQRSDNPLDIKVSAYATPSITNEWNGTTDNDWAKTTNWSTGALPTASENVFISSGLTNYPTITTGSSITVTNITLASGASLIAEGTSTVTGNITYNRTIDFVSGNLNGWFLIGSPIVGETYNNAYATSNGLATSSTKRGLATYTTDSDTWSYLQENGSNDDTFTSGVGYAIKRGSIAGDISFTGNLNTTDAGINGLLSTGGKHFNLLGNPYTSFLSSATFLDDESAISETKTMWVFNQTLGSNGEFEVKTVGQNFKIAPGQGFFVKANSGGGTFNFDEANQDHNADTFQKGEGDKTKIKLSITDGPIHQYATVYFLDNATNRFDVGYEGELFNGSSPFAVYSHLIEENEGKKFQIQSLPNSNLENTIIPIGVNANDEKEITFNVISSNLPERIKIYLEDRQENIFTRLDETNTEYKITLAATLNDVGRFYLHTVAKTLSIENVHNTVLNSVSIYKSDVTTLRIAGLTQGKTSVSVFNILGKKMIVSSFEANGVKDISLPKLATGIYFVKLQTSTGKVSKKIVFE
ncbi:hypothetical protein BTO04_13565 [Polaribacter sp. SA4-10]|uniref:T9SS type A sorting domain-containing protein n=1 Tax=Polaribacter sp. SA4-10 TaxID=754397 RepID=UPI000B3BFA0D|nr:T9SS type A sorting domain-containing protein [Polaribacter sp. SA4-10]ARV07655.1 hypothetical protein BTO04_13565 [Polaribacter sp. SA4-10]